MGAALLSAKACLRSGAGLLTVHIPGRGEQILQTAFPEAMVIWTNIKIISVLFPVSKPTLLSQSGLVWENIRIPQKHWNNCSK